MQFQFCVPCAFGIHGYGSGDEQICPGFGAGLRAQGQSVTVAWLLCGSSMRERFSAVLMIQFLPFTYKSNILHTRDQFFQKHWNVL